MEESREQTFFRVFVNVEKMMSELSTINDRQLILNFVSQRIEDERREEWRKNDLKTMGMGTASNIQPY